MTERTPEESLAVAGWQPIETAPKNGDEVLLLWPKVSLDEDDEPTGEVLGYARVVSAWSGGEWLEPESISASGAWFGDDYCFASEPIGWWPLPPSPELAPP